VALLLPVIGARCHELRIPDSAADQTWRILYRTDPQEILVVEVFSKKTPQTPRHVIDICIRRLRQWDAA
jgi:phage-related protein